MAFDPKSLKSLPKKERELKACELALAEAERLADTDPSIRALIAVEIVEEIVLHFSRMLRDPKIPFSWGQPDGFVAYEQYWQWEGEALRPMFVAPGESDLSNPEQFWELIRENARIFLSFKLSEELAQPVTLIHKDGRISIQVMAHGEASEEPKERWRKVLSESCALTGFARIRDLKGDADQEIPFDLSRIEGVWHYEGHPYRVRLTVYFHHLVVDERINKVYIPARVEVAFLSDATGKRIPTPNLDGDAIENFWQWASTGFQRLKQVIGSRSLPIRREIRAPDDFVEAVLANLSFRGGLEVYKALGQRLQKTTTEIGFKPATSDVKSEVPQRNPKVDRKAELLQRLSLSETETAEVMGTSTRTIRNYVRDGKLARNARGRIITQSVVDLELTPVD